MIFNELEINNKIDHFLFSHYLLLKIIIYFNYYFLKIFYLIIQNEYY